MKLTKTERWILSNQYRILEKLCPDEADEFAEAREVVECGYEQDYGGISQHIDKVPMSVEDCKEVVDILLMFSEMKYAFDTLDDKSGIDLERIRSSPSTPLKACSSGTVISDSTSSAERPKLGV